MLVHVSDRANADLLAIVDWLSETSSRQALAFIDAFEGVLDDLRRFPDLGTAEPDGRTRVLRRRDYRYLYTASPERVTLLRIVDPRWLSAQ